VIKDTPLSRQYQQIKAQYPDTFLFFRLGDFYELFGDDAIEASKIMEVTLTKRQGYPMCGVPFHSATTYIKKILNKSKSVAICEQVEEPSQAKGIVKREVVRVITPGTIIEDSLLTGDSNNFIVSVSQGSGNYGLVFMDISTGDFMGCQVENISKVETEISRLPVREAIISSEGSEAIEAFIRRKFANITITKKEDWYFSIAKADESIKEYFNISTLKGWELDGKPAVISACGGLVAYLTDTQKNRKVKFKNFTLYSLDENMILDRNAQENLELVRNLQDGKKKNTLFEGLDFTSTAMGKRKLAQWILRPLKDTDKIRRRHAAVEELIDNPEESSNMSELLKQVSDMERIISKASLDLRDKFVLLEDIVGELENALKDQLPLSVKEGNMFKQGYSRELDDLISITSGDKQWVADLEERERARLDIPKLKVGYNKVHGYYIEVTKVHSAKVPPEYQRKQTLVNSERYTTEELKNREDSILGAQEKRAALEYKIFCDLRDLVSSKAAMIQHNAEIISRLDVLNSFSIVSTRYSYVKPHVGDWDEINIQDGRHPMVEKNLGFNEFIPNDTFLDKEKKQILIITGPNMAGKSTYLKQVAIITVMAQIGCYVPASDARIGIVDRIFTRIGASENLAGGESTFMVEMTEVASILNNATSKSLLIMDEVGRGTSTFDGISIAWAVIEALHDVEARTLFATHYFELTELSACMDRVINYNFAVREWTDKKKIVFLRKLQEGSADKSYGIHCAQLAGVPESVIQRSWQIFNTLEEEQLDEKGLPKVSQKSEEERQMSFFGSIGCDEYKEKIKGIDLNSSTPLDIFNTIREWQSQIKQEG
jgi:DNA mismatch repair protein MutS